MRLDNDGFTLIENAIDARVLERLRERFEDAAPKRQSGTRHTADLQADEYVLRACTPPVVLEAVQHVLQLPFNLQRIHGRDPLKGYGQQGLHADWTHGGPTPYVFTCLAFLDDFDAFNGSTRVVPGTHRLPYLPDRRTGDPAYVHPRQVVISGSAGTILAFNGHLWHSGTLNRDGRSRRALQYSFVATSV